MIGWVAATGNVGLEPLALFLIIFLWTPPHFWALALNRTDDYASAGVPMLPVVAGKAATTRQILIYSGLLALASELPWMLGLAGAIYGVIVAICGTIFLLLAGQLNRSIEADRRAAHRLFVFSMVSVRAVCGPPDRPWKWLIPVHAVVACRRLRRIGER